jgi:adenylate cyclase
VTSPGTVRRVRLWAYVVLAGVLVSLVYGLLAGAVGMAGPLYGAGIGVVHGFLAASVIGGLEIFGTRTAAGRRLEQAPFLATFGVKWLVYGAFMVGLEAVNPGARFLGLAHFPPLGSPLAPLSIAFGLAATFAVVFLLQVGRLLGGRTLADLVLGRYHQPRPEERFFLFVDIAGSTALAERLGPAGVHRFLAEVFHVAADPVDDHRGEVHQYVGDELVVTWTLTDGRQGARPVRCFFAIDAALAAAAPRFERAFGTTPRLRAALHAGPVIAGEVGDSRRAIVFHGDVMNTAARLEQLTRTLGRRFLVSADALDRLGDRDGYAVEDLGPQPIRGRAAPVRVFAVEASQP